MTDLLPLPQAIVLLEEALVVGNVVLAKDPAAETSARWLHVQGKSKLWDEGLVARSLCAAAASSRFCAIETYPAILTSVARAKRWSGWDWGRLRG